MVDLLCVCWNWDACFYARNAADTAYTSWANSTVVMNDGNWHHIVAGYDPDGGGSNGDAWIKVDGEAVVYNSGRDDSGWEESNKNPFTIANES